MTPKLSDIKLSDIPWQKRAYNFISWFDYKKYGTLEVLLSGSLGSAKSVFLAYIVNRLAIEYPRLRIGIGRKSLKDLKATLMQNILEMGEDLYFEDMYNKTEGQLS